MATSRSAPRSRPRRSLVDELIRAAQSDDRQTFDRTFELWFDAVFARALRARDDASAAQESTGDALRKAIRSRLERA